MMHVLQYGDQCVAFGRHHGNMFYIDVHGSKRLPRPGVFLVHFKCIEDLVNHGIKADAKECAPIVVVGKMVVRSVPSCFTHASSMQTTFV